MSVSNTANPHALDEAQSPSELFEIMEPPKITFDPYNDKPISTNSVATRANAHRKGLWHCSVHVWIVTSSSLVLLQKRSMKKDTFPGECIWHIFGLLSCMMRAQTSYLNVVLLGRWDISSAGHIEAGKSPIEAAYAEVAEELGVDLKLIGDRDDTIINGSLQYAFIIPAEQAPLRGCNAYEHVYFLCLKDKSELKLSIGTEEVTDVTWMDSEKLIESLRSKSDEFAPRTAQYVDAMEKYIIKLSDKAEA